MLEKDAVPPEHLAREGDRLAGQQGRLHLRQGRVLVDEVALVLTDREPRDERQ